MRDLNHFCIDNDLKCVSSLLSNNDDFTYINHATGSRSNIDHFIVSESLTDCINKYTIINDVDNMSDHLPVCIHVNLPVNNMYFSDTRQFIPKPKWYSINDELLHKYKSNLDVLLESINVPDLVFICRNVNCVVHNIKIQLFHDAIIAALLKAPTLSIPFTEPKSHFSKSRPGWNKHVKQFKTEAINWHVIWLSSGYPSQGYVLT